MTDLDTPLSRVLPKRAATTLRTHRELETVGDLLGFLPRRYLERHEDLGHLEDGAHVVFVGTVVSAATRRMRNRPGTMLNATVRSGEHELDITFFRSYGHEGKLQPGRVGLFAGETGRYRGRWQLTHPAYEMFDDDQAAGAVAAGAPASGSLLDVDVLARPLLPVYRQVKALPSWTIGRLVQQVLDGLTDPADPVPEDVRRRRDLPARVEAYRLVHLPETHDDVTRGRRRLTYDEALAIQTALAMRRHEQRAAHAVPRRPVPGGLLAAFDERLPFELTQGQHRVGEQIADDLAGEHPMNRLLQGEVGSGKTVVALRAMLAVVDAGGQAALLAPTEVLAAQHHRSITAMLGDLAEGGLLGGADQGTRVALLTGSRSAPARRQALLQAASGEAGIVVGTHALIQENVQFADLGLVVVDEQHRFGVEQRDALRGKAEAPPHVLLMTATPIPRTVAMTVFGDMETSVLDELPRGRAPIATHVVDNPRWYARAWERVAEEVAAGHQAYVVCPRIGDEDETPSGTARPGPAGDDGFVAADAEAEEDRAPRTLRGVVEALAELRATPALQGLRVEMMHGRMPADEKDAVMTAFSRGEVDVLVSTTVIEVGVDVPNATTMVILDADRFGVSQLHQLRGRVGRGGAPGLCLLVAVDPSEPAREMLAAVASTTDGFELSRLDLQRRREGDVLGARQSGGGSGLKLLRLSRREDERIIAEAREDAAEIVESDPDLVRHPALRRAVAQRLDEDQAAFLERG